MHNLVIVKPGALEKVGKAGNEMAKDKNGLKKNYIPNLSEVLWSTPQLKQNTSHTIRFNLWWPRGGQPRRGAGLSYKSNLMPMVYVQLN